MRVRGFGPLVAVATLAVGALALPACRKAERPAPQPVAVVAARADTTENLVTEPRYGRPPLDRDERQARRRETMVQEQLISRGIRDSLVLAAMRTVPRHLFVPAHHVADAYADGPLPIGYEQTISQPYIVAFMTEALGLAGGEKVLEVGTGSGYQAAVLAEIADDIYTIEIVEPLGVEAEARLKRLHYDNVHVRIGDGYRGWPEQAPFDAIMVTAAPDHVPPALVDQLKVGGRLILPVGEEIQELVLITKTETGTKQRSVLPVRFVPMTGEARTH